jgi:hypothetical protein
MTSHERPIPNSYWVKPGRLLAGDYPGDLDDTETRRKVQWLLDAGVTFFVDLTEESEAEPYARWLGQAAEHHRMPIPDWDIPTPEEMAHILDTIDAALEAGHTVYVHCWYGIGRTATVIGCYLVRHGLSGDGALQAIARLRKGTPKAEAGYPSPATQEQQQMVSNWSQGR